MGTLSANRGVAIAARFGKVAKITEKKLVKQFCEKKLHRIFVVIVLNFVKNITTVR